MLRVTENEYREGAALAEEQQSDRRSGDDRRASPQEQAAKSPSAWSDPRTWVSICGILLTICMAIGGFLMAKLSSIEAAMQALLISTTVTTTQHNERISQLQADNAKLHAQIDKMMADQTAYNFDLSKQMTIVNERLRAANGGK
jgi:hypothetical protein